jgi:Family of unknown function (DUF5343)
VGTGISIGSPRFGLVLCVRSRLGTDRLTFEHANILGRPRRSLRVATLSLSGFPFLFATSPDDGKVISGHDWAQRPTPELVTVRIRDLDDRSDLYFHTSDITAVPLANALYVRCIACARMRYGTLAHISTTVAQEVTMNDAPADTFTPPYISFAQLQNVLERMRNEGVPSRVDRSYLGSWSGSAQAQFLKAARSLGLIDDFGRPTETLKHLVREPDNRPALIAQIINEKYPDALALGKTATQQQLEEVFRGYDGISGSTTRKAITFYLHAAKYAGIELSPFFSAGRSSSGGGGSRAPARRRSRAPQADGGGSASASQHTGPPAPSGGGRDELHPAIRAMVDALPTVRLGEPKPEFPERERQAWVQYAQATFNLIYASDTSDGDA